MAIVAGFGFVLAQSGLARTVTTVVAGVEPYSVAVNPVTNKVYVTNYSSTGSVTVIDGTNNTTVTVPTGVESYPVAVNPVTNKVYVANIAYLTVIDGASNSTATVIADNWRNTLFPNSVAVNPVTNKVYVANMGSEPNYAGSVTVIDGATNSIAILVAGATPYFVAVNPVTNKIYVANSGSNNVTVIDGATNSTATVVAGVTPYSVAVNPVTNKIYVANRGSNNVTVIDGATNSTATVVAGSEPYYVAVNPVTNKVYVANRGSNNVTVIDGSTNSTSSVSAGSGPSSVAINQLTNKIYVANQGTDPSYAGSVTVIDGVTNGTSNLAVGSLPTSVAVNSVTNKVYVANALSNNVTVIDEGFPPAGAALFLGADAAAQGNWTGKYGTGGYFIPNGNSTAFDHANLGFSEYFPYTWAGPWSGVNSDPRNLQTAPGASTRIASAITNYVGKSFYIHLNIYDDKPRLVALYLLDWDGSARSETITITDASTGQLYDKQTISGFHNGTYALWELKGNLTIQVTPNSVPSAVVSGIFIN